MLFNLTAPCAHCPFRRDCLKGWLGASGAQQIAAALETDNKTFECHKTTHKRKGERSMCAGALHVVEKSAAANALIQIAQRLGLWRGPSALKNASATFDTFREFEAHHGAKNH